MKSTKETKANRAILEELARDLEEINRQTKRDKELEKIAQDTVWVDTLETRKSDSLDFYDISVWQLKEALQRAYELGRSQK